jgi:phytoene synthase
MTVHTSSWEARLLDLAFEPQHTVETFPAHRRWQPELEQAYRHCAAVTRTHSRTFYLASGLLPTAKRQAARALYAFCRTVDDLVDRGNGRAKQDLEAWAVRLTASDYAVTDDAARLVALAWNDARHRYCVPRCYAEQLIAGVAHDLTQTRYHNFDELAAYCYGVASTVGLMSMHIIGFSGPQAIPYAIKLGVALQLTNILRDVGEDWRAGRLYLPLDELAECGLSEADIAAGRVDARWRAFMQFQIDRARRLYGEAWPGIQMLDADGRFAITAAADLYRAILTDIEAHDYDVFSRRAHVSTWGKLHRLPGIWRSAGLSLS